MAIHTLSSQVLYARDRAADTAALSLRVCHGSGSQEVTKAIDAALGAAVAAGTVIGLAQASADRLEWETLVARFYVEARDAAMRAVSHLLPEPAVEVPSEISEATPTQ